MLIGLLILVVYVRQRLTQTENQTDSPSSMSVQKKEPSTSVFESENTSHSAWQLHPTEEIVSEEYVVKREGINLYGVITASRQYKNERRPLIIISHGFNNTLEMYEEYAEYLAHLGFIVYRFDFYGGSVHSKSGGTDMLSMSVLTEKEDLSAVVETLSKEPFVNVDALALLGVSQGGVVSTLYAAENPNKVSRLILIFPAFVLFDDVKETYAKLGISSTDQIPEVMTHRNARLGAIYIL